MSESIAEKIRRDIARSGFPLELFVLNVCSRKSTGRLPNIRYKCDGELREVDLVTSFETMISRPKHGENIQHTITCMVIACKKSAEKPWVFFSTPGYPPRGLSCFTKYCSDFDLHFSKTDEPSLLYQIRKHLPRIHYSLASIPVCINYCEAFRRASKPSDIYGAVDSILSYLNYALRRELKRRDVMGCVTVFYFPIIVLEGLLFEAQVEGDQIEVQARDHIQLRTLEENGIFVVDVVRKEHFGKFFELIEQDHNTLVESINGVRFPRAHKSLIRAKVRKPVERRKLLEMSLEFTEPRVTSAQLGRKANETNPGRVGKDS